MARQLLLIAEPLLAEGLRRLIQDAFPDDQVGTDCQQLNGSVALVVWFPDIAMGYQVLAREVQQLSERWQPASLLLVLPQGLAMGREQIMALPAQGLLQTSDNGTLMDAIATLLAGGRVVQLNALPQGSAANPEAAVPLPTPLGLGQWLLVSGLQQIDAELQRCDLLLQDASTGALSSLILQGRRRELQAARQLLLWIWGPISLAWGQDDPDQAMQSQADRARDTISLTLNQRNAEGAWQTIVERLSQRIATANGNSTGQLLALEALLPERRCDLLLALLEQLQLLRSQLLQGNLQPRELSQQWFTLQAELRRLALRRMASPYVRLPYKGELLPVAESLIQQCRLEAGNPEVPDPQPMLQTLVLGQPLLVDGQLLPPDAPLAVLHLERLLGNWLLRSAEQVSAEVLGCCAAWPELRRYLLVSELLSTRNLERLRNQLNAQQRWSSWLERPVLIYESKRQLLTLEGDGIHLAQLTEPRDTELAQLSWGQQLVTLALEARDAIGPQLHKLIEALGRLLVLVLTQIVGRSIGLIGKGIMQGMGRGLQRS